MAVYSQWCECMLPYNIEGSVTFQGLRACGTQPMCVICSFYYHNLGGCIVYVSYLWPRILLFFSGFFLHIYYLCVYVCVLFSFRDFISEGVVFIYLY